MCDAAYGLSVGRGSFYFAPGNWTRIRQTVTLNTPGAQDGGFLLEVNGKPAINRSDVYYRDAVSSPGGSSTGSSGGSGDSNNGDDSGSDSGGGLLGGLLGPLRIALWPDNNILMLRDDAGDIIPGWLSSATAFAPGEATSTVVATEPIELVPTLQPDTTTIESTSTTTSVSTTGRPPLLQFVTPSETSTSVAYPTAIPGKKSLFGVEEVKPSEPVGFTGLFFRCVYCPTRN